MARTTTSATRPGRRPKPRTDRGGLGGFGRGGPAPGGRDAAYTITEIVLAIGLLAVLAAVMVTGFGRWHDTERVEEGARRVEAILRMARAEAASSGRRIRLCFNSEDLRPVVEWEPSPLAEPGVFLRHPGTWANDLPEEELHFNRCQRTGSSALSLLDRENTDALESAGGGVLQPVTFYPDGSFDSAIIELIDPTEVDQRVARIDLDSSGLTIRLRMLTPTEQEDQAEIDEEAGL